MTLRSTLKSVSAAVLAASTFAVFAQDLPRSGRYTALYAWTFSGQIQELGANRIAYVGMLPGVILNDAGKGFIHKARVDCTIVNDVNQGRAAANGTCVITDAEGDKGFITWKCAGQMPACPGDFLWTGGTGKYTGISGAGKFQGNFIGMTGAGWSDWNGEYKLP